jgi:hypothetical protein
MKSLTTLFASLYLVMMAGQSLTAVPSDQSSTVPSGQSGAVTSFQYKMISGYKQPFNDDMQLHFSKGWIPAGGVSVTTWNNDLFFAVLLKKISRE